MDDDLLKSIRLISSKFTDACEMRLCREVGSPPLAQITSLLKKQPGVIEPNLTAIDYDLVIPQVAEIDIIAVSKGRLVMIGVIEELSTDHLAMAAGVKQWSIENMNVLTKVYSEKGMEKNSPPRILLLCSGIKQNSHLLMSLLGNLPLEIFCYRCMETTRGKLLTIEKISADKELFETKMPAFTRIDLTDEELKDFFKTEPAAETLTASLNEYMSTEETPFSGPYFTT